MNASGTNGKTRLLRWSVAFCSTVFGGTAFVAAVLPRAAVGVFLADTSVEVEAEIITVCGGSGAKKLLRVTGELAQFGTLLIHVAGLTAQMARTSVGLRRALRDRTCTDSFRGTDTVQNALCERVDMLVGPKVEIAGSRRGEGTETPIVIQPVLSRRASDVQAGDNLVIGN